jgi:curli production assembly/transport component CsgG
LEESNWFIAIEREGLSNLLNERRIIRQTQEQFQSGGTLPPLLYAGIIIEGGIIAYESNIRTGGAGARYFGTGASGQYREDQVSIFLRAVSTSTGRILKTVHASKTILSQKLDVGVFRFVSLKKLLEAEVGYTHNEPSFLAVQEAIDKAVFALIAEGIKDDLWKLKNPHDKDLPVFLNYQEEKEQQYKTDYLGNTTIENKKSMSLGLNASGIFYDGDYSSTAMRPGASIQLGFIKKKTLSLNWNFGIGKVSNAENFKTNMIFSGFDLEYKLFRHLTHSPFIFLGYGLNVQSANNPFDAKFVRDENMFQYINTGVGYRWQKNNSPLGISISGVGQLFLNDKFDGVTQGQFNDRLWMINIGFDYRFNLRKQ